MKIAFLRLAGVCLSLAGQRLFASDISTIEANSYPQAATVTSSPVVTAILTHPGLINGIPGTSYSFVVQDGSGSLVVVGTLQGLGYTPAVGDAINFSGAYNLGGVIPPVSYLPVVTNLTSLNLVSSGNSLPTPAVYTIPQLNQSTLPQNVEGYLVELQNVTISGGSGTFSSVNKAYTVTDTSANSMELMDWASYLTSDAAFAGTTIPTGLVDIFGVDAVSGGVAQLVPYQIVAAPEPSVLALATLGVGFGVWGFRRRP